MIDKKTNHSIKNLFLIHFRFELELWMIFFFLMRFCSIFKRCRYTFIKENTVLKMSEKTTVKIFFFSHFSHIFSFTLDYNFFKISMKKSYFFPVQTFNVKNERNVNKLFFLHDNNKNNKDFQWHSCPFLTLVWLPTSTLSVQLRDFSFWISEWFEWIDPIDFWTSGTNSVG
jgi:hypothetical protein